MVADIIRGGDGMPTWVGLVKGDDVDAMPTEDVELMKLAVEPMAIEYARLPLHWSVAMEDTGELTAHATVSFAVTSDWGPVAGYLVADAPVGGRAACYVGFDDGEPCNARRHDIIDVAASLTMKVDHG